MIRMESISNFDYQELDPKEALSFKGGGPIIDAVEWYYKSVGSFYKGLYDGLMGNEPVVV